MRGVTCVVLLAAVAVVCAEVRMDEILALPGWPGSLPSRQFSGYLNITASKHIHYWLVHAEVDPENAPVVVWLNGGPGCSSLDGLMYEHGPFRIDDNDYTKLVRFNYTWAKLAHMLYLEAPVGVGFSYSDDKADYDTDDDKTAADNLLAVEKFFELYPELKSNGLFITGESYAGVYVPTLAEAILFAQRNSTYTGAKLRGIAVGNGCAGTQIGVCGGERQKYDTEYLLGQAFIPSSLKKKIIAACNFDAPVTSECTTLLDEMATIVGNINLYNIYGECLQGTEEEVNGQVASKVPFNKTVGGPNACIDSRAASGYFAQPEVVTATHVVPPPFRWATCANQIHYTSTRPNLPRDTYPALVEAYRVVIYNGDWDACVPYTDNEAWTEGMQYSVADPWHPWTYNGDQVAGYATRYSANNFTFVTVRGGRHEVPETAPEAAFELLRRLITDEAF